MRYAHILAAVTEERWALKEEKLLAILDFLRCQAAGEKLSAEEIQARIERGQDRAVARQEGVVAVLPLRGVIANRMNMLDEISGGTSSEGFGKAFQAAMRDDGVKAIIFDVDTPGGAVSGADELSSMIYAARGGKPIIAHVNAMCASAGYWIASAADEVVVTRSGSVGSIGVYGVHTDISQAMDKLGVKKTLISAGKFKVSGNELEPLDDETRDRMQTKVNAAYEMFVKTVARNRKANVTAVRNGYGQGDTLDAEPALAEGMIDRIATLDETLQRFGASAYGPPPSSPSKPRAAFARERAALDLRQRAL